MPKEFTKLQAQDMGKVGATQDLLRGIEKLLPNRNVVQPQLAERISQSSTINIDAILKRGQYALEDSDWKEAVSFFNHALNINAECGEAFLGLAMAEAKSSTRSILFSKIVDGTYPASHLLARARQFANTELQAWFSALDVEIGKASEKAEAKVAKLSNAREKIREQRVGLIPRMVLLTEGLVAAGYPDAHVTIQGRFLA